MITWIASSTICRRRSIRSDSTPIDVLFLVGQPDELKERAWEIQPDINEIRAKGGIWFTRGKDSDAVYASLTKMPGWKLGERKEFLLKSVRATDDSVVSVLGQSGQVLEYNPDVIPETRWNQREDGLLISVMRAQRLYNNKR